MGVTVTFLIPFCIFYNYFYEKKNSRHIFPK